MLVRVTEVYKQTCHNYMQQQEKIKPQFKKKHDDEAFIRTILLLYRLYCLLIYWQDYFLRDAVFSTAPIHYPLQVQNYSNAGG